MQWNFFLLITFNRKSYQKYIIPLSSNEKFINIFQHHTIGIAVIKSGIKKKKLEKNKVHHFSAIHSNRVEY